MSDKLKSGINIGQNIRVQRSAEVKELTDRHGKKIICSRCLDYAVQRVGSERLCPTCLLKRKERQAHTAQMSKCRCGNVIKKGNVLCGACADIKAGHSAWLTKLEEIKNLDEMKIFLREVLEELEMI